MNYLGGKTRIGAEIAAIINRNLAGSKRAYWEPFVGALGVMRHIAPVAARFGSDVHSDLIAMWIAIRGGWRPPLVVSEHLYIDVRDGKIKVEPCMRAFIGFGCSYSGKWFGGYSKGEGRNYADENARAAVYKMSHCKDVTFFCADFERAPPLPHMIIYCDPPYAGTTGYKTDRAWSSACLWGRVREWASSGHMVFVSEYQAPGDFVEVWSRNVRVSTGVNARTGEKRNTERLFVYKQDEPSISYDKQLSLFDFT